MTEAQYQNSLIKRLAMTFPGIVILKNDPTYIQGIPDLILLYRDKWAMLEVKKTPDSHHQPNQEYYVNMLNGMSYARFVYPQNEREIIDELIQKFGS